MRSNEIITSTEQLDENLRKWFKEKWVRFGPDGKIRGSCARGDDSEGKPKCLPQAKAHALGKKGRKYAASKKRREDPNPERRGPAKNVATKKKTDEAQLDELKCWPGYTRVKGVPAGAPGSCKKKTNEEQVEEKWSQKYKDSINCSNPKGFSQKAHCAGKKKDESMHEEHKCPHCGGEMVSEELMNEKKDACYYKVKSRYKVWPSAYASGALVKCRKKGAKNWGNKTESVAEGLSKRDLQDVAAIKAAIERLQAQLSHPNADKAAIQQSIAHEKKRLALYGQGVAEGSYEGASTEDVANAILGRIIRSMPELISRYGPEALYRAVEDVASFHEGAEELGTSDISNMVREVIRNLEDVSESQLNELSPETLASYKKKAGQQARELDKAAFGGAPDAKSKIAKANKRFSGIMKATKKEFKESHILHGIMLTEQKTYKLWESAGRKLVEAQLTADQIQQIFQQVEQGATAGGANRTLVGKGVDAASAVNKAWEDLKTKVQNSGPIKNVDAMYDKAAEKLKQATGGDQGVMKYVQKYRDFAKKHPVAQSLIYAALIAAAGISGAGLGGAAALGLFKMTDKLLQGEKFSSAAYSGAKTGAMAYGASQIGKALKGADAATGGGGDSSAFDKEWDAANKDWQATKDVATKTAGAGMQAVRQQASDQALKAVQDAIANGTDPSMTQTLKGIAQGAIDKFGSAAGGPIPEQSIETIALRAAIMAGKQAGSVNESIKLDEATIGLIFYKVALAQNKQVSEGIMDTVKGAASKAANWVGTKAKNVTTKVTADKLMSAWKKAGSPTDSEEISKLLASNGVADKIISDVFSANKIPVQSPAAAAPSQPATPAQSTSATAGAIAQPSTQASAAPTVYKQVQSLVSKLDKKGKQRIAAILKKDLGLAEEINEFVQGYNMGQAGVRKVQPKHVPNQNEIQRMSGIMEGLIIKNK